MTDNEMRMIGSLVNLIGMIAIETGSRLEDRQTIAAQLIVAVEAMIDERIESALGSYDADRRWGEGNP